MLLRLLEWFRTVLFLVRDVEKNKNDIADLQQEVKDLSDTVAKLQSEMLRGFENERHEREKLILRLENVLLRFERSLPPSKPRKRK